MFLRLLCVAMLSGGTLLSARATETAPVALFVADDAVSPASVPALPAPLRSVLDEHLAAINARDLDALLATVTRGERLVLILPNGKVMETRGQYRQLHVDWFKETDWRMVFEVQDVREFGDVGIARVKYDSQAKDVSGRYASKRIALLSLVFAKERGEWRLVYDQNTVIPATSP